MSTTGSGPPAKRGRTDATVTKSGYSKKQVAANHKKTSGVSTSSRKARPPEGDPSDDIDNATWRWFQKAVSLHIQVTGPMVQSTALKFALEFGHEYFRASNAWLQRFREAHHIANGRTGAGGSGASNAEDQCEIMGSFFSELPELCASYLPEDVFSTVEVGLLHKALPCRRTNLPSAADLADTQTDYLTILLTSSAAGEKLMPVVIGKEAPVFPSFPGDILPVEWRRNPKAWMTSRSFVQWLNDLNVAMCSDQRNIILFLSSGLAHPNVELSNVRLCFFPPKQPTSILPLHHGVSQTFKAAYRRQFLAALLEGTAANVAGALQAVTVLEVACLIDSAWRSVSEDLITRAFESAGFPIALPPDLDGEDDGHVSDTRLRDTIRRAGEKFSLPVPLLTACEYVNMDSWVPVYPTIDTVIPRLGPPYNGGGATTAVASVQTSATIQKPAATPVSMTISAPVVVPVGPPVAVHAAATQKSVVPVPRIIEKILHQSSPHNGVGGAGVTPKMEVPKSAVVRVAAPRPDEVAGIPSDMDVRVMIERLKRYAQFKKPEILPDILQLEGGINGVERQTCCECNKVKQVIVLD